MVNSLNSKALLSVKAECFNMVDNYGKLLLGNNAFEFYSDRNLNRNIQIPWNEIAWVRAVVVNKKYFGRFTIETRDGQSFSFAARQTKKVLQTIAQFVDPDHIVHAQTLAGKLKEQIFSRKKAVQTD